MTELVKLSVLMNNSIQDIDKTAIDRVKNALSCCSKDCHTECNLFDGSRSPTDNNCNAYLLIQMFKEGADWASSNKQPSQHNWNEISQNPNLNEWILVEYISNEIIYDTYVVTKYIHRHWEAFCKRNKVKRWKLIM